MLNFDDDEVLMATKKDKPWWRRVDGLPPVKPPRPESSRLGQLDRAARHRPTRFAWAIGGTVGIGMAANFYFINHTSAVTAVLFGLGTAVVWGLVQNEALRARARQVEADEL